METESSVVLNAYTGGFFSGMYSARAIYHPPTQQTLVIARAANPAPQTLQGLWCWIITGGVVSAPIQLFHDWNTSDPRLVYCAVTGLILAMGNSSVCRITVGVGTASGVYGSCTVTYPQGVFAVVSADDFYAVIDSSSLLKIRRVQWNGTAYVTVGTDTTLDAARPSVSHTFGYFSQESGKIAVISRRYTGGSTRTWIGTGTTLDSAVVFSADWSISGSIVDLDAGILATTDSRTSYRMATGTIDSVVTLDDPFEWSETGVFGLLGFSKVPTLGLFGFIFQTYAVTSTSWLLFLNSDRSIAFGPTRLADYGLDKYASVAHSPTDKKAYVTYYEDQSGSTNRGLNLMTLSAVGQFWTNFQGQTETVL